MSPSTTSLPPELPMSPTLNGPVLIIGSGLLGASIGLGLHAAGYEDVYVQDISPTAEAVAQDIGAGTSFSSLTEDQRARFEPQLWLWPPLRMWPAPCARRPCGRTGRVPSPATPAPR